MTETSLRPEPRAWRYSCRAKQASGKEADGTILCQLIHGFGMDLKAVTMRAAALRTQRAVRGMGRLLRFGRCPLIIGEMSGAMQKSF